MDLWSEAAIEQNRTWLTAYLLSLAGSQTDAEDMVQEVFLVAYEKRNQFAAGTNFGGFLRNIAKNVCRRHFEQKARRPLIAEGEVLENLDVVVVRAESRNLDPNWLDARRQRLRECVASLSSRVQRILQLRYGEANSSERIAGSLEMTVPAVNVALFRARETLGKCVKNKEL